MSHEVVESETRSSKHIGGLSRRLDAVGWGLFFIWVGVSTLADLGWGIGLLGVAAVILLMQAVRRYVGRRLEPFWLVVGSAVLLGGIWELYRIEVSLVPVVLILVGGALLLSVFGRRWDTSRWCRSRFEGVGDDSSALAADPARRSMRWCRRRSSF